MIGLSRNWICLAAILNVIIALNFSEVRSEDVCLDLFDQFQADLDDNKDGVPAIDAFTIELKCDNGYYPPSIDNNTITDCLSDLNIAYAATDICCDNSECQYLEPLSSNPSIMCMSHWLTYDIQMNPAQTARGSLIQNINQLGFNAYVYAAGVVYSQAKYSSIITSLINDMKPISCDYKGGAGNTNGNFVIEASNVAAGAWIAFMIAISVTAGAAIVGGGLYWLTRRILGGFDINISISGRSGVEMTAMPSPADPTDDGDVVGINYSGNDVNSLSGGIGLSNNADAESMRGGAGNLRQLPTGITDVPAMWYIMQQNGGWEITNPKIFYNASTLLLFLGQSS